MQKDLKIFGRGGSPKGFHITPNCYTQFVGAKPLQGLHRKVIGTFYYHILGAVVR